MQTVTKLVDYLIGPQPIRIVDLKAEPSRLCLKSIRIAEIGHLPGRTSRREAATFEQWAFAYIAAGSGTYRVDGGETRSVGAGCLFFVYPGAVFDYGPVEGGSWDEYYVRFEGSRTEEWRAAGLLAEQAVWHVGLHETWMNRIETMLLQLETGLPADADRAALLLESLLVEFARKVREPELAREPEAMAALLEDLSGELYRPVGAARLAERHHLSVSTLRRLVRQLTGYPFHEYVLRLKLEEAKRLLLGTSMQVQEIARSLGFDDNHYFSRLFKQRTGLSPRQFRRRF